MNEIDTDNITDLILCSFVKNGVLNGFLLSNQTLSKNILKLYFPKLHYYETVLGIVISSKKYDNETILNREYLQNDMNTYLSTARRYLTQYVYRFYIKINNQTKYYFMKYISNNREDDEFCKDRLKVFRQIMRSQYFVQPTMLISIYYDFEEIKPVSYFIDRLLEYSDNNLLRIEEKIAIFDILKENKIEFEYSVIHFSSLKHRTFLIALLSYCEDSPLSIYEPRNSTDIRDRISLQSQNNWNYNIQNILLKLLTQM